MGSYTVSVLFYLVYCLSFNILVESQEPCQTPENTNGQCLVLQECSSLNDLVKTQPFPQETIDYYLRKAYCGFSGKQPKVCCATTVVTNPDTIVLLPSRRICGQQVEDRLLTSTGVSIGLFSWMALIQYQKQSQMGFHCEGSLINNRYVLTAAHCLLRIPKSWKVVSVRLGENDLNQERDCEYIADGIEDCSEPPVDISVEEQIPHELYDPEDINQQYDIALLRLSQEVQYTDYIKPICLPLSDELRNKSYVGQSLPVVGWGRSENRGWSYSKQKVYVSEISKVDCAPLYKRHGVTLVDSQVCAGGGRREDLCTSDSGGTLMATDIAKRKFNYIAYGVVSFGSNQCGLEDSPAIYTRVADYVDWIRDKMRP